MKLRLPRDRVLKGTAFGRVLPIELNDFDVDALLPALFYTVLAQGHNRARQPKLADVDTFVAKLAEHPDLQGFDSIQGRRLLGRLTRTALLITSRQGRARQGEQILAMTPYSLLAHKPGFPVHTSRLRRVDSFLYQTLLHSLGMQYGEEELRKLFKFSFGRGVLLDPRPYLGGRYDGSTHLDTLTRLSIALVDGMEAMPHGVQVQSIEATAYPGLTKEFADDLLRFLYVYADRMPAQAFTFNLRALINFELFIYTLKVANGIAALVAAPQSLPPIMRDEFTPSPPEIYMDFTGARRGLNFEMAAACVRRDVESYQHFFSANLRLRLLHNYVEQLKQNRAQRALLINVFDPDSQGAAYLQGLAQAEHDPQIGIWLSARAMNHEAQIKQVNVGEEGDEETYDRYIEDVAGNAESPFDRLVLILAAAQARNADRNLLQWYRWTGGQTKPYGLLAGTTGSRTTWRYAPSNDLLSTLVQLAAIRIPAHGEEPHGTNGLAQIAPFRLRDFLAFLERRFGILVDRPPNPFRGADYAAAARENLRALERRLRQMGIFRDLSDDFTLQRLHPPYMENGTVEGEAER